MGRVTIIIIGIITTLIVFAFVVVLRDNYHMSTTIFIKPNNEIMAAQADHVINNIAEIPQKETFITELNKSLSQSTNADWNQQVRTARQAGTGYIAVNIRTTSQEQTQAISVEATRLWMRYIEKLYVVTDEVDVQIIESKAYRGSWYDFVLGMTFSLLIGILISLILLLINNTFLQRSKSRVSTVQRETTTTQTVTESNTAQPASPEDQDNEVRTYKTPPSQMQESDRSQKSELPHQAMETQPSYIDPIFSQRSQLRIKEERPHTQDPEEAISSEPHHARAQERNFIAATTREKGKVMQDVETEAHDLFEIYGQGTQQIGKKMHTTTTASAPENLPVVEPTMQFGDFLGEASTEITAQRKRNTSKEPQHTPQPHKTVVIKKTKLKKQTTDTTDSELVKDPTTEKDETMSKVDATVDSPDENKIDNGTELHFQEEIVKTVSKETPRATSGVPANLPIVGVTGKTTAAQFQSDKAKLVSDENQKITETIPRTSSDHEEIDLEREPTDEELKRRLNQLLQGKYKS